MARLSYQEALERFTHIDAEFVSFQTRMPPNEATLTVRLYPWWEHPSVLQAVQEKKAWKWTGDPEWQEVTVFAFGVVQCSIAPDRDVIDWYFHTDHPLLWPYEDTAELFANEPVSAQTVLDIIREAADDLKVSANDVQALFDACLFPRLGKLGPISLGEFPATPYNALRRAVLRRNIELFEKRPAPVESLGLVAFCCDLGSIIAEDFQLEVPEFKQLEEWCVVEDRESVDDVRT